MSAWAANMVQKISIQTVGLSFVQRTLSDNRGGEKDK
jgi:hypothetical protein